MYSKTIELRVNRSYTIHTIYATKRSSVGSNKIVNTCPEKMSEESESSASQRDKTTHDFVTGLKEREDLKSKLHDKERECNTLKGKLHDMNKKVEDLEKQVSICSF